MPALSSVKDETYLIRRTRLTSNVTGMHDREEGRAVGGVMGRGMVVGEEERQ